MGICLSCGRRDRKAPEKSFQHGQSVVPLHVCVGECDKGEWQAAAAVVRPRGLPAATVVAQREDAMANTISNLKVTNPIKVLVSKSRRRYIKDGFDLDLTYITDRLIAMGFPAEKLESVYRNDIDDVYKFLEQKHKDHYKVYNLCSETSRSYDSCKFHERVAHFPFDDHNPPRIELIQPFCQDVHEWLTRNPLNVAAVHCKAGKGRTGTMVCCYLLHSGQFTTAADALSYYGQKRTHDKKGVTIPSQRRYVEYYAVLISNRLSYKLTGVQIRTLSMSPAPAINANHTIHLAVSCPNKKVTKMMLGTTELRKNNIEQQCITITLDKCFPLYGDVKVEVYATANKPKVMMRKEKLFHFWFNTFFVTQEVNAIRIPPFDGSTLETFKMRLDKCELDGAHKDKQNKVYAADFKVDVVIEMVPETYCRPQACSPNQSTTSEEDDDDDDPDDEHWDSEPRGEDAPSTGQYRLLSDNELPTP